MIPTFNCATYLRHTLESVLAQDPGPAVMQIEVVDDASAGDDPEAVVREVGRGRVGFFRKRRNEGAIPNFNTCIRRSRGQLVHILHGDDTVEPGFYERIQSVAGTHPHVAAFFVRCRVVDKDGALESVAPRMRLLASPTRSAKDVYYHNTLFTPGVVVRRDFYQAYGGFLLSLVHCADWEMWIRVISQGGGLWINELLASYRIFQSSDTNRLARTGENMRDRLRVGWLFARKYPDYDCARLIREVALATRRQVQRFAAFGDDDAEAANRILYRTLTTPATRRLHDAWDSENGVRIGDSEARAKQRRLLARTRAVAGRGRSLYIWGAGQAGRGCLNQMRNGGVTTAGFIDSDPGKDGSAVEGLRVFTPLRLQQERPRPFVVVASMYAAEIEQVLQKFGLRPSRDYVVA